MSAGWAPGMPAGTVSLLSADAPASAALAARLVASHGGSAQAELGADGRFSAAFARASDAVACTLTMQRDIADGPLRPRIAVHTGAADRADGTNLAGEVMDRCSRLRDCASAGQVVLSEATADLVADGLPADAALSDLGWHRLADLGPAVHVWQLCHPVLQARFPPLRSLDASRHNLPVQLTTFIGRRTELSEVGSLTRSARLVTLTGAGGCGKTRLALHVAAELLHEHADGVWLAELAALHDPRQVPAALSMAIPLAQREAPGSPEALAAAIGTRELLVVLDNCEHLVRSCAEVADCLLRACPRASILATSREPLGVPGEITWRVPSLSFPADAAVPVADLGRFEAVRLFLDRMRHARPGYVLASESAAAAAEICARLDGIPLAIELAAARARVLTPIQIAAALNDRFRLLTGGARTAMPRQQTLEASVAWSYNLLPGPEQALLRDMSVFAGGFTLAAAEAVGAAADTGQVLHLLSELADKSLITAEDDRADGRFRMLESIRDYAARRLDEAGQSAAARSRHLRFFLDAAVRRPGEDEDAYCPRLRADYDNIRVALSWAASQDDPELLLTLATRLVIFWSASTHLGEALHWMRTATERGQSADPALRARALGGLGQIASLTLDLPTAISAGSAGLALLRQLGDTEGMIVALTSLGSSATLTGEPDAGRAYLREAAALAEQVGDLRAQAYALALLGRSAINQPSSRDEARQELRRSIDLARQCGAQHVEGVALAVLGTLAGLDCAPAEALPTLTQAGPLLRETGDVYFLSLSLVVLVHVQALQGDFEAADAACRELYSIGAQLGATQLYYTPFCRGWAAFCRGDWTQSISSFREQLSYFGPVGLSGMWVGHLAWAELITGQRETARERLDEFIGSTDPARTGLALPWAVRALVARADGEPERAEDLAHEALAASPADPFSRLTTWSCLAIVTAVKADEGHHELAARLAGAASGFARAAGTAALPAQEMLTGPAVLACRDALGQDRFAQLRAEGEAMTLAEAVAYAGRGRGSRSRPSQGWASLTPTELQVAAAVADGLSNPEIAARMFISRRTVTTHLTSIFRKLGITSRTDLAVRAARHGQ